MNAARHISKDNCEKIFFWSVGKHYKKFPPFFMCSSFFNVAHVVWFLNSRECLSGIISEKWLRKALNIHPLHCMPRIIKISFIRQHVSYRNIQRLWGGPSLNGRHQAFNMSPLQRGYGGPQLESGGPQLESFGSQLESRGFQLEPRGPEWGPVALNCSHVALNESPVALYMRILAFSKTPVAFTPNQILIWVCWSDFEKNLLLIWNWNVF